MGFQLNVYQNQGAGVPGEQYSDGPWRSQSFTINSDDSTNNNIGSTMCSITDEGICAAGNSSSFVFAGLLVDPKTIALLGSGLTPTLNVPNFTQVECATMGSYVVTLPDAANIGDWVVYDNTTGAISTVTPGTSLPMGKSWGNSFVDYFNVPGAGLGIITMNPGVGQPTNV